MKRSYRKRPLFDKKRIGMGAFTLFIVFVAYKILTPPSIELAQVSSPDSSRTARLRKFYYVSQPSYKIDYRTEGKLLWLNLLNHPGSTNTPPASTTESLSWSPDSETLHFKINGTSVWHHAFE